MNNDFMEKISSMMEGSEMFFLRGQLRNIMKASKSDGSCYYLADLRVPRTLDLENIYGVSFNLCHICLSSDFVVANAITDGFMKDLKDNEVLVNLDLNCSIKSFKNSQGGSFKSNNVKFFVKDILKLSNVSKLNYSNKEVVNL